MNPSIISRYAMWLDDDFFVFRPTGAIACSASGSVNRHAGVSLRTSGSQRLPLIQTPKPRLCLPPDSASRPASAHVPAGVLLRAPPSPSPSASLRAPGLSAGSGNQRFPDAQTQTPRLFSLACSQAFGGCRPEFQTPPCLAAHSLNPDGAGFSSKLHEPPFGRFMSQASEPVCRLAPLGGICLLSRPVSRTKPSHLLRRESLRQGLSPRRKFF